MKNKIQCDIAIIGAGAGGLSLAAGAAQLGAKVVLIESGKMGGDCLNYGCVPSKSLLAAAKSWHLLRHASHFGIHMNDAEIKFLEVMRHVKQVISTIAKNDSVERFESLGVEVIQAKAKFLDEETLLANDYQIKAKRFVIAAGSSPFVPPIKGIEDINFLTNETIFELKTLPEHLIIIGGGPIGCELAQAFAMLGSKVTILEASKILPKEDEDCSVFIRYEFSKLNINVCENIKINEINQKSEKTIFCKIEKDHEEFEIEGSHLLIATGRRANISGLDLEKAKVKYTNKGINVNKRLRSSNKKIYAIGDVIGSFQFTHVANYHASVVLKNILFRIPTKIDYKFVSWVTYTYPEIAHIGLNETDVIDRNDVKTTQWLFSENDRAQTEHQMAGKIKIITDKSAHILGVTIVGAHAGELILPWIVLMRQKKSLRELTDAIVPYPTLSEINKRVASEFYAPKLFSKPVRWLIQLLLKLG